MTNNSYNKKHEIKPPKNFSLFFTVISCISVFTLSLLFSDKITHSVKSGLSLCANVIIPSVFPFMVLSDLLYSYIDFSNMNFFAKAFEKIFKINRVGIYPFLLGTLCGFPLGVKCAVQLYYGGKLTKNETERIIGFCNNTGPAFLVSGIGLGLRGNISDGIILYLAMLCSAVAVGFLFSLGAKLEEREEYFSCNGRFSLTESIKNAGVNTINICSYLTFFACIVGIMKNFIGKTYVYLFLIPFLEVGSATSILSKTSLLSPLASLILSAFAVGFSGISVHLQALSFITEKSIGIKKYFIMKLVQGVFSAAISVPLYLIFL